MRPFAAALAAASLLGAMAAGSPTAPPVPASPDPPLLAIAHPGERFLSELVGEWVGTARQRVNDQEPLVRYFRLVVRRRDAQTFETEICYFRPQSTTGALEEAGRERGTSTLDPDGSVRRRLEGNGTVLVDYRPKPETHAASGCARLNAAGSLEGEATGTLQVDGLPLGLGRRGRIERAREEWSIRGGALSGRTSIVARFRSLFITRRFRVETNCRGERGADVAALAAREVARRDLPR